MSQMMPDVDSTDELADNFDGVAVSREQINGTFEYEVSIDDETLADLPERKRAEDFAESIATSRFEKEVDPTFSVHDAMAKEGVDYCMNGERRFTVWVRFDQID